MIEWVEKSNPPQNRQHIVLIITSKQEVNVSPAERQQALPVSGRWLPGVAAACGGAWPLSVCGKGGLEPGCGSGGGCWPKCERLL